MDLLVRKGAMAWDRRPCTDATTTEIDLLALRATLSRMDAAAADSDVGSYLDPDREVSPFIPSLCVKEPMTGIVRPRNFAVLLFGYRPQRFIPGAVSIYSRYPGRDRSDPTASRFEFAGTLPEQLNHLEHRLEQELETRFDKTDLEHPNAEKYPLRALREAMVNALAHRDYVLPDPTRLTSFADRIEVVSPGSLPLGVTIEDLRRGRPTPRWRNQCLAWFLNRMQLAQAEGQGLVTIRRTMKALGCPPPRFQANEAFVQCILPANRRFASVNPN